MLFGYGNETTTRIYPDGSVEETETAIRNNQIVSTKTVFSHRVLVKNEQEILSEFIKFRQDHKADGISFEFDTRNNNNYIIKKWSSSKA